MAFGEQKMPHSPATPLSIPSRKSFIDGSRPANNISALLAETRIPRRFSKTRRKSSHSSIPGQSVTSPSVFSSPDDSLRTSLFEADATDFPSSIEGSLSYLLTSPNSMPSLSRSCSTNSFDSQLSVGSSYSVSARVNHISREQIDFELENPLFDIEEDIPSHSPPDTPPERRNSLNALLKPLKAVAPAIRASAFVSSISANLASWANSLSTSQFDDDYGLLPSADVMCKRNSSTHSRCPQHLDVPRPVKASGPVTGHTTIIEAEMERAALADQSPQTPPPPIEFELLLWSSLKKDDLSLTTPSSRPREPRLNPDFLRILVLETNMRRLGKIGPGAGRARMILSPRCQEHRASHLREQTSFVDSF